MWKLADTGKVEERGLGADLDLGVGGLGRFLAVRAWFALPSRVSSAERPGLGSVH